jgi:ketosteroid isomerase-like protein
MGTVEQDKRDVAAVIEQYRLGFATLDVETLNDIWDQGYENIIYIPLEAADPVRGWAAVEQYYNRVASLLRARVMTVSGLSVDVIGDVAYAFCTFHFEGEIKGKNHTADGRNTFILRRKNGAWKVIHYHESGPGPLEMAD